MSKLSQVDITYDGNITYEGENTSENENHDELRERDYESSEEQTDRRDEQNATLLESFSSKTENEKGNDDGDVKPSHSYIALIAMAILSCSSKKMILGDIYQYISDNYPYYRNKDKSWRNSIRHNLSLNECFIKAGRSENGKGNYWAIHPANLEDFSNGDFRRRRARRRVRKSNAFKYTSGLSTVPYLRSYGHYASYSSLISSYKGEDYYRVFNSTYHSRNPMSPVSYKQFHPYTPTYPLHSSLSSLSPLVTPHKSFAVGPYSSSLSALASLSYGCREVDSWQDTLCKLQETFKKHHPES